jgi:hypothetical protein
MARRFLIYILPSPPREGMGVRPFASEDDKIYKK